MLCNAGSLLEETLNFKGNDDETHDSKETRIAEGISDASISELAYEHKIETLHKKIEAIEHQATLNSGRLEDCIQKEEK